MAAHLSMLGHEVTLHTRNEVKAKVLRAIGGIRLVGRINGTGYVSRYTSDMAEAVTGAEIIMITTVANAHRDVALKMAPYLSDGQIVVLNPGRTGGASEFRRALDDCRFSRRIFLVEAQTLVYACRIIEDGLVNIVGVKENVLAAALPAADTDKALNRIREIFPCFHPAHNVLETSLENIGAVFHPSIILFNAAAIERGEKFYFYRDITQGVVRFIERLDAERTATVLAEVARMERHTLEGQALDLGWVRDGRWDVTPDDYLYMVRSKTAWYTVASPLRLGALAAGGPRETADGLERVGLPAGLAFQLQDDLLNLVGDAEAQGKDFRSDITEGKRTLAVVWALAHLGDADRDELVALLGSHVTGTAEKDRAVGLIERGGGVERCRELARECADEARGAADDLARDGRISVEARDLLCSMADFFVERAS